MSKDNDNQELRGILNSGHTKTKAFTMRVHGEGKEMEPKRFSTWSPMVISMIKLPAATLVDRSIVIEMQKKPPDCKLAPVPMTLTESMTTLRTKIMRFVVDNAEVISEFSRDDVPHHDNARTADNWWPLFAVAHALGDKWPDMVSASFQAISTPSTADEEIAHELLSDIKSVFDEARVERIFTKDLLDKLYSIEDAPWVTWKRGNPMDSRSLYKQLRPYGVQSITLRIGHERYKGYEREMFKDLWRRYLKEEKNVNTPEISRDSVTLRNNEACSRDIKRDMTVTPCVTKSPVTDKSPLVTDTVTDSVTLETALNKDCHAVTDVTAKIGGEIKKVLPRGDMFPDEYEVIE